jgi:meso-butanediol dehydrogenase / (S,S)-butanediol dehydrogenase / diacetyl reductase
LRLKDRLAVVTGAASGIGAAVVQRLLEEGAQVVGADLSGAASAQAGAAPAPARPSAQAAVADRFTMIATDVSDETAVRELIAAAEAIGPVEVLVNVAGIGSTTAAPDTPLEVWERVFAVNARGTFLTCKHAIPAMAGRGRGTIVNVASVAGQVGLRNRAAYCASKGAVIALTRALAVDHVGQGIRVNCVCPGTVDSPWVRRLVEESGESLDALRARQPMGRLGLPREVAEAVLYLADEATGGFITGSELTIDGGLTAA